MPKAKKAKTNQGQSDNVVIVDTDLIESVTNGQSTTGKTSDENVRNNMHASNGTEPVTKQMLETLMLQNNMLMELLKVQARPANEIMFAPDFHKSIPMFNGLDTRCQAIDWLKTVNRVANINRWPDNFKLQSVRNNLECPAGHWFLSRNITSWIDFENQFKRTFVGEVLAGDRWKEVSRRVQLKGENVLEYFHEKVYLCSVLELGLQETKIQILEGLFSKDLSVHLLSRDHVDTDELLNVIVNFERPDIFELRIIVL